MKEKNVAKKMNYKTDGLFFYCVMFAIPIIQFSIFYIGVNFNSILLAFKKYDALTGKYSYIGIENFRNFMWQLSLGNTLKYAWQNSLKLYFSGFISTALCLCFSYYIYKGKTLHNTLRVILFLPSIISSLVFSIIFRFLSGLLLPELGLPDFLANPETQFGAIIFFGIWVGFGSGMLLYSGAMGQVPPEVVEAAEVDGAGPFRQFFQIILPSIYPTISTFLITGIAGIFTNQAALFNFYGEGADPHSYTLGYYLFVKVVGNNSSLAYYPDAAAAGLLMTLVAAPLTLLMKWALEKFGPSED